MMGSRVRVTQAAPKFLRKIKGLDPTIWAIKLETSLSARSLSPRCLQKNAGYRIRMASSGGVPGLDVPLQSGSGVGEAANWSTDWPKTTVALVGPVCRSGSRIRDPCRLASDRQRPSRPNLSRALLPNSGFPIADCIGPKLRRIGAVGCTTSPSMFDRCGIDYCTDTPQRAKDETARLCREARGPITQNGNRHSYGSTKPGESHCQHHRIFSECAKRWNI